MIMIMMITITYHHTPCTRKDKKAAIVNTTIPHPIHKKQSFAYLLCFSSSPAIMRVPITPPSNNNNNNNSNPQSKSIPNNNNIVRDISFLGIPNSGHYEPTSVLDLRRSPSPVTEKPGGGLVDTQNNDSGGAADWDDNMLHNLDWDSLISDLGLPDNNNTNNNDDSSSNKISISGHHLSLSDTPSNSSHPQFVSSDFNLSDIYNYHHINNPDFGGELSLGFDFIEELIRAADCFDSNELQVAQLILARLNNRLHAPAGKPLQRAAFYFKEALQSLLSGSNRAARPSSCSDVVQSIKAYKAFSAISPIPMFSQLTANQALLEAIDGSIFVHVIDFDIGFGGHYASLMKELAESCSSPVLRISAVVPDELSTEARLIKDNLSQFALDLKIGFQIDLVSFRTFEMLSFKSVKFMEGEKTAVHLSPSVFGRLGSMASIGGFLGDMRRVSPSVVVLVDGEGWMESRATSFRRNLVSSLELYSMVFESLEGAVGDWNRKIEMLLLRPKIAAAVEAAGRRRVAPPWRDLFHGAGMRPVQLSQFADFQAECLLGKLRVRGFHVAKRQAELMLCWHDRALVTTSAWRC